MQEFLGSKMRCGHWLPENEGSVTSRGQSSTAASMMAQADAGLGSGNLNFAIDRAANHVKVGHQADVGQRPDGIIDKRTGAVQPDSSALKPTKRMLRAGWSSGKSAYAWAMDLAIMRIPAEPEALSSAPGCN